MLDRFDLQPYASVESVCGLVENRGVRLHSFRSVLSEVMSNYTYLSRFSPERLAAFTTEPGTPMKGGGRWPHPEYVAAKGGAPEAVDIDLGKSSYWVARTFADPSVLDAVLLPHEMPAVFYNGLHEQWLGVLEDESPRYATAAEVADLAGRLKAVRLHEALQGYVDRTDLSEYGRLQQLIRYVFWFERLQSFYAAAAERGDAVIFYCD